ncbi:MAG: hypothetical protein JW395_3394 [Nitrospira sp.]|nr:hypothetical protein [Nitrospira sp.]
MKTIDELRDKQEITEVIHRYCHALDRNDRSMADTIWHADGTADYRNPDREDGSSVSFQGTGQAFLNWVFVSHATFEGTSHQVTNILIELDGDHATSASYVTAALWTATIIITIRARYNDTWTRRDGRWAIERRCMEHDLRLTQPRHTP